MSHLVGVTTSIDPKGGDYRKPRIGLYANYLTPLERNGLTPILITPAHSKESIRALIAVCDGLVLSGGDDIDPSRYGHDAIPELGTVNPSHDIAELRALDEACRHDIPILGICRGHQMLNVLFGGTLCQDIGVEMGSAFSHQQTTPWGSHHHEVTVEPGTRLAKALGEERLGINSYHHQAIRKLAPQLVVSARADDGLVEGIESTEHRWVVGVQWHPERHEAEAADSDPNVRLFKAFAGAVKGSEAAEASDRIEAEHHA
ncbi:MAG: gamma-glutamyl-gamma-aminobutyrate hydrolase family protein [Gemmatimonadota bacterium]